MTGGGGGLGGIVPLLQSLTAAEIARAFAEPSGFEKPADAQGQAAGGRPAGALPLPQGQAGGIPQGNGQSGQAQTPAQGQQAQAGQAVAGQALTGQADQGAGGVFTPVASGSLLAEGFAMGLPGAGQHGAAIGRETAWSHWLSGLAAPVPALGKGAALLADGQLQQAAKRGDAGATGPAAASQLGGGAAAQIAAARITGGAGGQGAGLMMAALAADGAQASDTGGDSGAGQLAARLVQGGNPEPSKNITQALLTAAEIQALSDGADIVFTPKTAAQSGAGASVFRADIKAGADQTANTAEAQRQGGPDTTAAQAKAGGPQGTASIRAEAMNAPPSPAQTTAGTDLARAIQTMPDLPAGTSLKAALSLAMADLAGVTGFPLMADSKSGGAAAMVIFNAAMIPQWPPAFKAQGAMGGEAALQAAGAQLAQMTPEEAAEYLSKMAAAFGFLLVVKKRLAKTMKEEKETLLGMFSFLGVALDTLVKGLQTALDLTVEQQAMLEELLAEGKGRGQKRRQQLRL